MPSTNLLSKIIKMVERLTFSSTSFELEILCPQAHSKAAPLTTTLPRCCLQVLCTRKCLRVAVFAHFAIHYTLEGCFQVEVCVG